MARRTWINLVSDTIREVKGQATNYEARQALQNSINFVDSRANWEFLLKTSLIPVDVPYQLGVVSVSQGSTALSLAGGVWSTSWRYKTIRFGSREMPYEIASFPSTITATLASAYSGTALSSGGYLLYQARYALPSDCEPGRDLVIRGPASAGVGRDGWIRKLGRTAFERRIDIYSSPEVEYYTDDELDETTSPPTPTIRMWPYPKAQTDYYLVYYRRMTVPTSDSGYVSIPEAFERILINRAAVEIMRRKSMPGWIPLDAEANTMMKDLYSRHAVSPAYDGTVAMTIPDDFEGSFAMNSLMYVRR